MTHFQIGPLLFTARTVAIGNMNANVSIVPTMTEHRVSVSAFGDRATHNINIAVIDGVLTIRDNRPVCESRNRELVSLSISVPLGTNLQFEEVGGRIDIGDTMGDVSITSDRYAPTSIGLVRNVHLDKSCTSLVDIQGVFGTLSVKHDGTNLVQIHHGEITGLIVDSTGTGSVLVHGAVMGDANVSLGGTGSVRIDKGVIPDLFVRANNTGSFYFGGEAHRVKLIATCVGKIDVSRSYEKPRCKESGTGKIRVHRVG